MFQGQIGEIPLPSPGKFGLFIILTLFFTRSSQNPGTLTQLKTAFLNNYGTGQSSQKFRLHILKITVSISNCKKTVFNYIFAKSHEEHLVIEWLP